MFEASKFFARYQQEVTHSLPSQRATAFTNLRLSRAHEHLAATFPCVPECQLGSQWWAGLLESACSGTHKLCTDQSLAILLKHSLSEEACLVSMERYPTPTSSLSKLSNSANKNKSALKLSDCWQNSVLVYQTYRYTCQSCEFLVYYCSLCVDNS